VGETSANNKKSPEDLFYLLDLKPGGKRYEITMLVAKRTALLKTLRTGLRYIHTSIST